MGKKLEIAIDRLDALVSSGNVTLSDLRKLSNDLKKLNNEEKDKESKGKNEDIKLRKKEMDIIRRNYFAMIHLELLRDFPKHVLGGKLKGDGKKIK